MSTDFCYRNSVAIRISSKTAQKGEEQQLFFKINIKDNGYYTQIKPLINTPKENSK